MKYLVMGAGRMSMGLVHDFLSLEKTSLVHIADQDEKALREMKSRFADRRLKFHRMNADDHDKIQPLMQEVDGVLSAVPYDYNLKLTGWAIENGCHFVDLGGNVWVVEKQFALNSKAQTAGVGIIPDCGLAPGMASVIAAHAIGRLDRTDKLEIRVGGLPVEPKTPLNYMLIFSVHGLTNEYIEPSIILENGKILTVPSMTAVESLEFPPPFRTLEAFYTSGGTSTLPQTYEGDIKSLNYKTIRYPGHCAMFKSMIDLGFTDESPIDFQQKKTTSRKLFERLLEETLTMDGDDVTLMRVIVEGVNGNRTVQRVYQLIDYADKQTGLTAMMRTTAFPAAIILEMLVDGRIKDRGVLRQELSIPPDEFIQELEKRNIRFEISEK